MNPMSYRIALQKEVQFLVFWGKLDRHSVMKMPRDIRKVWVELTSDSLKQLFGKGEE